MYVALLRVHEKTARITVGG